MNCIIFWFQIRQMPQSCMNNTSNFCYVSGEETFASQNQNITAVIKNAYHHYFCCKVGFHIFIVTHVKLIFTSGSARKDNQCHLQSQWFGENQQITVATVTFVWFSQFQRECQEKRNVQWSIQIFHQLCALFFMAKNFQFLRHQISTFWTHMMIIMMTWIQLALSHQRQLTLSLSYHIPLLNHTSYHRVNQMTWLEIFSYLRVKQSCLVQTKTVEPLRKWSQDVFFLWSQK